MTTVKFDVQMSPSPYIGQLMRAADLCDRVSIHQTFVVTWKEGEVVDDARKRRCEETIKKILEDLNYECYSVSEIQVI